MSVTVSYPGVYIEELPSGVHTITGVATSIAAFVGWAPEGLASEATLVQSWSDFANQFGGLTQYQNTPNYLGYAVNQFFNNGGQQAYIVRLVDTGSAKKGHATVGAEASPSEVAFKVEAVDEGQWSSSYGVRIVASTFAPDRFTLFVVYTDSTGNESTVESFTNLSNDSNDTQNRFVQSVINDAKTGSNFIDVVANSSTGLTPMPNPKPPPTAPTLSPPASSAYSLHGGQDGTVLLPGSPAFHSALNTSGTPNSSGQVTGVHELDTVSIFNLLCVPGETDSDTIQSLQGYCRKQRAFYIVDCASDDTFKSLENGPGSTITQNDSINSALYFPWVQSPDPLQQGRLAYFPPCGYVAGIYATTDVARGVWKAPAGIDASLTGSTGFAVPLTDLQNGTLNTQGINCLRNFPVYGDVVWGARTLRGNDLAGSEWKYVPIRRFALFLESSLYNGTQWVVFEPNDERLWGQIRLNIGVFMQGLFLQGAFQGSTPQQAYFVKCDSENNPQSSIDQGIVNILVGFAPLYPAEFVIIQIQQMAGQLQA
jgi:phage tail sheath protein FI